MRTQKSNVFLAEENARPPLKSPPLNRATGRRVASQENVCAGTKQLRHFVVGGTLACQFEDTQRNS